MRTRTPRKRAVPVGAAAAVAVTLLAGCAVNAGTAKARQFEADWEGTPDVSDVSASGANNLPFSGTADGTAVVAAGTPDERVAELLHALGGYVREHGGVDATLEVGHVRLGARPDREANDAVLDLWHGLRVEPGLVSAELGVRGVDVDLDDPTRFADLVEDLATPGGDLEPLADAAVDVRAGSFAAVVGAGDDSTDALAAFRAVDERFGVTGAHLETTPPRVELRVADSADSAAARALARRAGPRLARDLVVEGGGVAIDGTDAQASARVLDLARTFEARPDVVAVTVGADGIEVRTRDVGAAAALEHDLADDPDAAALGSVVATSDAAAPADVPAPRVFRAVVAGHETGALTAAQVRDLGAAVPALVRLAAQDQVDAELVESTLTEDDVATLARELAVRVPAGTPVQVRAGGAFAVRFTAGQDPEPEEITYPTRIGGDVFLAAWRDAWP